MNTHYAVVIFDGDFDNDHPDLELRGHAPRMTLVAAGSEDFCWQAARQATQVHPLRRGESVEVLARTVTPG